MSARLSGNNQSFFDRLDFHPTAADTLHLNVHINAVSRIVAGPNGTNIVIFENGQELCTSRIQSQRLRRILRLIR